MTVRGTCPMLGGVLMLACFDVYYYLRSISTEEWLAYPPKLTVELGSYVHGEAHGWAR